MWLRWVWPVEADWPSFCVSVALSSSNSASSLFRCWLGGEGGSASVAGVALELAAVVSAVAVAVAGLAAVLSAAVSLGAGSGLPVTFSLAVSTAASTGAASFFTSPATPFSSANSSVLSCFSHVFRLFQTLMLLRLLFG